FELFELTALLELLLQLVVLVELVGDRVLVAVGDEHQGVATCFDRLVHRVLDQRPLDDWEHLLGDGRGGGAAPGAKPGARKDCLAYPFVGHRVLTASRGGNGTTVAVFSLLPATGRGANPGMSTPSACRRPFSS